MAEDPAPINKWTRVGVIGSKENGSTIFRVQPSFFGKESSDYT